jgi:hypothetical protein
MHPTRSWLLGWSIHHLNFFNCWSIFWSAGMSTTRWTDVEFWSIAWLTVSRCRLTSRPIESGRYVMNHQCLMFQQFIKVHYIGFQCTFWSPLMGEIFQSSERTNFKVHWKRNILGLLKEKNLKSTKKEKNLVYWKKKFEIYSRWKVHWSEKL